MKMPLAYVTAAWSGDPTEATEQAARYCRAVYEAGFRLSALRCISPCFSMTRCRRSTRAALT